MKHGANIYKYAKKLGCKSDEIFDFSSNINSYHPPLDIKPTNSMIVKYADTSYNSIKKSIKNRYKVKKSQIALYNGATVGIFELFKVLNQKRVYLYAPIYSEYEKAAKMVGKKIIKINRFTQLNKKIKKDSIVVFVNPTTPDGKYYNLKKLFKVWMKKKCTIVLDESFLEFEGLKSFRDKISSYKKLYIVHSFSKFNSCAGVRVGAIFSDKKNIKNLKIPIWNLSSFDVEFLKQRLDDDTFMIKTKKLHKKNKKELYKILKESKLFDKVYKSKSNFFLTRSKKAKKVFKHLLKYKILVRDCKSFDFLNGHFLRFGVKNPKMHKKLLKVLNG
jgi:threonine-phosphate decarboxylase